MKKFDNGGKDEASGRRDAHAGQKKHSGKKQGASGGKDQAEARPREATIGLHRSETESMKKTSQKIDSGKRTSAGRKDKP